MTTLRIEHAIRDYAMWKAAFDAFAEARAKANVREVAIRQPADDPTCLMLDLEFDTAAEARAFAGFLEQKVWSSPAAAPALVGVARTRILNVMPASGARQ